MSLSAYKDRLIQELIQTQDLETAKRRTLHLKAHCYPHMQSETRQKVLEAVERRCAESILGEQND